MMIGKVIGIFRAVCPEDSTSRTGSLFLPSSSYGSRVAT